MPVVLCPGGATLHKKWQSSASYDEETTCDRCDVHGRRTCRSEEVTLLCTHRPRSIVNAVSDAKELIARIALSDECRVVCARSIFARKADAVRRSVCSCYSLRGGLLLRTEVVERFAVEDGRPCARERWQGKRVLRLRRAEVVARWVYCTRRRTIGRLCESGMRLGGLACAGDRGWRGEWVLAWRVRVLARSIARSIVPEQRA